MDPWKLWIPEEIGRYWYEGNPQCKSGMAQGKRHWEKLDYGQHGMRNLERTEVREEASAETGTQIWDKEQMCERAATKQEGIHQDLQANR
jgi:hypothetical protein